jgi:hypothetical protein
MSRARNNSAGARGRGRDSQGCRATSVFEYAGRAEFPDHRLPLFGGKLAFDPNLSIADAKFHANTGLVAYVRSFDFAGQSAKFDVIVPAASFAAQGFMNGLPQEREMSGLGDPRFRVSVNLLGAPRAVGEGLRQLPAGSHRWHEPSGFRATWTVRQQQAAQPRHNRWSFKPELGISKDRGPWTFEVAPQRDNLQRQHRLLRRQYFRSGANLRRSGTHPLHVPVRCRRSTGSISRVATPR